MKITPITLQTQPQIYVQNRNAFKLPFSGTDTFERTEPKKVDNACQSRAFANDIRKKVAEITTALKISNKGDVLQDLETIYKYTVTDPLAKTKNKRALFLDLETYKKDLPEKNKSLSVAMFDMDNFKAVNDLLGYKTGDEFIKIIGSHIQKIAKDEGFEGYRFGGEEFLILFPDTNEESAAKIADKARWALNHDKKMSSSVYLLCHNATKQIMELQEQQMPYDSLEKNSKRIDYLDELFARKEALNIDDNDERAIFLNKEMSSRRQELADGLNEAVAKLLGDVTVSLNDKDMLKKLGPIDADNAKEQFESLHVNELLKLKYDNSAKIAQIQKWMDSLIRSGSFTITCGVKEFDAATLKKIKTEDVVNQTGDVLKEGKKTAKGELYRASKV